MACIIEGAEKLRWSVPEWIARNSLFFLVPELLKVAEAKSIAERLANALEQRASFISLSDFFMLPASKKIWREAIDRADKIIAAEDSQDWNEPSAYEPFRTSFNKLRMIVPN